MVKVFIRRRVLDQDIPELMELLKKLRSLTLNQPGYISGETLKRLDQPGSCVVISIWTSKEDWDNWLKNEERAAVQAEIDRFLGTETQYEVYG
ncbi:antibiotic biosynthesis monooxygenase [Desulfopila sp. IMCC35008]|uniref:antibiotic biosynthesis monooxygenase family protein n=1 Tax=Desulfopila sp. IMCC35008 TaxID=2653858 RepID=UPI0013D4C95D|nr:antibiotic biosynthesis monooxygenase family protein [Desulfopila sp. IMCC35008]